MLHISKADGTKTRYEKTCTLKGCHTKITETFSDGNERVTEKFPDGTRTVVDNRTGTAIPAKPTNIDELKHAMKDASFSSDGLNLAQEYQTNIKCISLRDAESVTQMLPFASHKMKLFQAIVNCHADKTPRNRHEK